MGVKINLEMFKMFTSFPPFLKPLGYAFEKATKSRKIVTLAIAILGQTDDATSFHLVLYWGIFVTLLLTAENWNGRIILSSLFDKQLYKSLGHTGHTQKNQNLLYFAQLPQKRPQTLIKL